ncbi:MAG: lipopolysaccharide assembly protein LapA domain-containing protein [Wenzhouxiangellaceae bacterium]|nr:lipopolysaccharide assembly protein LapA domain-containing protein [Wenzhouxiangellaceae bacterium]
MRRWLLALAILTGTAGGIVLGALNPQTVQLELLVWQWSASLGAVFAAALGLGLLVGVLIGLLLGRHRRARPLQGKGLSAGTSKAGRGA